MATDNAAKDDTSKSDLDKLRGTWLTVSLINDGKTLQDEKTPAKEGPTTKVAYDGDKWMIKVGDKTVAKGILKVDSSKKPKEIDILDESGMKNEKTKPRYLRNRRRHVQVLSSHPPVKPRPTEFTSKEGSGHTLEKSVMKREKP